MGRSLFWRPQYEETLLGKKLIKKHFKSKKLTKKLSHSSPMGDVRLNSLSLHFEDDDMDISIDFIDHTIGRTMTFLSQLS